MDANILYMTQKYNLGNAREAMDNLEWELSDEVSRNRKAFTDFDVLFDMTEMLSFRILTEEFIENE
jgi:hypothetical protein